MTKNKGGRPTKYNEGMIEKVIDYYSQPLFIYEEVEVATATGVKTVMQKIPNEFPIVEGFCDLVGIDKATFYNWCDAHPSFFDAYKQCKAKQARRLVTHGLMGTYNASITRLMLSICTDYRENKDDSPSGEIKVVVSDERSSKL
jgi:hypothetical protein